MNTFVTLKASFNRTAKFVFLQKENRLWYLCSNPAMYLCSNPAMYLCSNPAMYLCSNPAMYLCSNPAKLLCMIRTYVIFIGKELQITNNTISNITHIVIT